MKKILLAFCSLADRWLPSLDLVNGHYSLGIGLLAAVLEQTGYPYQVLYMPDKPQQECLEKLLRAIADQQPEVVGFGMMSDNRVATFRAIEALHHHYPQLPVIIGGVHTTVMYKQLLEKYSHLIAVLGEGERTLPELLAAMEDGRDLAEVAGIAFMRHGRLITTPARPLIENLDELPFPKHELFFTPQRTEAQIMTSRGCPFRCSFCVLDVLSQRRVRHRSVANVLNEIEMVLARFPQVRSFQILDDQFFLIKRHVLEFCDEIVRRGLHKKVVFLCQGRVKPLDREMVLALERANFINITLGLESGSSQILKRCHKGIVPKDALRAMELLAHSELRVSVLLIIGLPGESRETILETVALCRELQKRYYHFYSQIIQTIFVYPGTEIHDIAKQAGTIQDDFWLTDQDVPIYTAEHPLQALNLFREMVLTHLCAERLFTPEGFASQREMIPYIIRSVFIYPRQSKKHFRDLVLHVARQMVNSGKLELLVDKSLFPTPGARWGVTMVKRVKGSDHQVMIQAGPPVQRTDTLELFVEYAYQQNIDPLTRLIDQGVEEFLAHYREQPIDFLQGANRHAF